MIWGDLQLAATTSALKYHQQEPFDLETSESINRVATLDPGSDVFKKQTTDTTKLSKSAGLRYHHDKFSSAINSSLVDINNDNKDKRVDWTDGQELEDLLMQGTGTQQIITAKPPPDVYMLKVVNTTMEVAETFISEGNNTMRKGEVEDIAANEEEEVGDLKSSAAFNGRQFRPMPYVRRRFQPPTGYRKKVNLDAPGFNPLARTPGFHDVEQVVLEKNRRYITGPRYNPNIGNVAIPSTDGDDYYHTNPAGHQVFDHNGYPIREEDHLDHRDHPSHHRGHQNRPIHQNHQKQVDHNVNRIPVTQRPVPMLTRPLRPRRPPSQPRRPKPRPKPKRVIINQAFLPHRYITSGY